MSALNLYLAAARVQFFDLAGPDPDFLAYVRTRQIDLVALGAFVGAYAVITIQDCGSGRFDFTTTDEGRRAFVCEAYGEDGETVVDLVGWPLDRPEHVMTMFGRCPMLGMWEAMNPATYFMGGVLQMHRSPLDWLKVGCRGAAIVTPHLCPRIFVDIPGRIAVQDHTHGRGLAALASSVLDPNKFLVPSQQPWRAAA